MQIVLKPITKAESGGSPGPACRKGTGRGFVESVAQCLKEADEYDVWRPVALYVEGKMVGFAMYGFFPMYLPAGRVWMDRLLIDERFQHKGYGKTAMQLLLEQLKVEYGDQPVYLSVVPGNDTARKLYASLRISGIGGKRCTRRECYDSSVEIHGDFITFYINDIARFFEL